MIAHNRPTLGAQEQQAAARVLSSGWVAQGPEVAAFEAEVCAYLGLDAGHAVALSSGTAALFLALWALQARGKRVAIPTYSCAAVRNAVMMAGGTPVPVDVLAEQPNIDLERAARSADIVVAAHIFGVPARLPAISVPLIEDCAQAFGARLDGRPVGLQGTVGIFSFYATKMITAGGQGGMLVSTDRSVVEAVRDYRQFDCREDRRPRFNLQMTDLQAAVGRAQLLSLPGFLDRRCEIQRRYVSAGLPLWPATLGAGLQPANYRAVVRTENPTGVIAHLEAHGVRAIVPIAAWELLDDAAGFPHASAIARSTVSLPLYPTLSAEEVATVIDAASILHLQEPVREQR